MKTVLDLFCGGFSKGFKKAGYKIGAGIDYEETIQAIY